MLQRIDDLLPLDPSRTGGRTHPAVVQQAGAQMSRSTPVEQSAGVRDLIGVFARNKALIAASALLCLLGAVLFSSWSRPQYHATTQIMIDPRDLQLLDKDVTPRSPSTDSGISIVESQARVLASDSVMLRVVKDKSLQDDQEFNGRRQTIINGFQIAISKKLNPIIHL